MKTTRLIRSLLAATLLWSASAYREGYALPSAGTARTNGAGGGDGVHAGLTKFRTPTRRETSLPSHDVEVGTASA